MKIEFEEKIRLESLDNYMIHIIYLLRFHYNRIK